MERSAIDELAAQNPDAAAAIAELRADLANYRALLDVTEDGYCIIEVLFDADDQPADYRFLETNAAFVRQTGLIDAVGRTMRELAPDHEQHWFDIYGRIARTGIPERFEDGAAALGRWYEVSAVRIGEPNDRRLALLFRDILPRRQAEEALRESEERQAFLLKLSDTLRPLRSAAEIQQAAIALLGEHLGVNRAGYYEVEADENAFSLTARFEHDAPPLPERMLITDFGEEIGEGYRAGRTMVARDTELDAGSADNLAAVRALQIRAWIGVPLVKEGRWVAAIGTHSLTPRDWTLAEIRLVEEVGERTWAAAERARIERALSESEEKYRTVFNSIEEGFCVVEVILDADGKPTDLMHLEANPAYERHTGLRDIVGKRSREIVPEGGPWLDVYGQVALTGQPTRSENFLAGPIQRWIAAHAVRLGGEGSLRVAIVFDDITERKNADIALRESEARLAAVFESVPIGITFIDADGSMLMSNTAAQRFLPTGKMPSLDSERGWRWRAFDEDGNLIAPDDFPGARARRGLRTVPGLEMCYTDDGGAERWVSVSAVPIRDREDTVTAIIVAMMDIDVAKRAQEALRDSEGRLQLLVAELQHRVRNILTIVRSVFGRTVQAGGATEEIASHFRGRLDALARTQITSTQTITGSVDLENLIRDELLVVGERDGERLTLDGPDVALDPRAAESIGLAIHELTTNAVKYGAFSVATGRLDIRWQTNLLYRGQRRLTITWTEQGVPIVPLEPTRRGFGSELIEEALPYRLGAETKLEFRGGGVCCTISVPLPQPGAEVSDI